MANLDNKENTEPLTFTDIIKYKNEIQSYEELIQKLQRETDIARAENAIKDKCVKSSIEEEKLAEYKITLSMTNIKKMENVIVNQCNAMYNTKKYNADMVQKVYTKQTEFSDLLEKYNDAMTQLKECQKDEEKLIDVNENKDKELAELSAMVRHLEEKCQVISKRNQQEEAYKKECAKLSNKIKRLNIKISSLESELTQKTEECAQLSAFYDDMNAKQSL